MLKKFFKNENGAITLFVLLAMLFFLIVIFSVFVASSNKEQSQVSNIDQIKQEYEQSVNNIDETYNEILSENLFNLLQIGDYVNYDPTNGGEITTTYTSPQGTYHGNSTTTDTTENMTEGNGYANQTFSVSANTNGWQILDIDKETNEVLLISADNIKTTDNNYFFLRGQTGSEWGIKELNDICEIYGKGKGATGARSITVDDINKIIGYDPEIAQPGKGQIYEYMNKVEYKKNLIFISYSASNGLSGSTTNTRFTYYDEGKWKTLSKNNSTTIESTHYSYSGSDYINTISDAVYDMLFTNTSDNLYWLASSYHDTYEGRVDFGLRGMYEGSMFSINLFDSRGNVYNAYRGVRPVVYIDISQIQPCTGIADGTDTTIVHMHQIK